MKRRTRSHKKYPPFGQRNLRARLSVLSFMPPEKSSRAGVVCPKAEWRYLNLVPGHRPADETPYLPDKIWLQNPVSCLSSSEQYRHKSCSFSPNHVVSRQLTKPRCAL